MIGYRWLLAAVFLAPLAAFPADFGIGIPQAKNAVFILLGLAFILWLTPNWWLRAFLAWAIVAFAASGMKVWGMAGLLGLLAWTLAYEQTARLTGPQWARVRLMIAVAALGQLAWMGIQLAHADPVFSPLSYSGKVLAGPAPAIGWFANASDTALFLGLSLPAVAVLSPWLAVGMSLTILWLLPSAGGFMCIAAVAIWLLWSRSWIWRAIGILGLIGFAAIYFTRIDPGGLGGRWLIWHNAWALGWMSPIVGWGPNAVGYRLVTMAANERWDFVFSEWLQGFVEFGAVGVGLALGYLISTAWRLRRRWAAIEWEVLAGAACLVAVSVFSIPFRIGPVALLAAIYLGRLDGLSRAETGRI